MTNSKSVFNAKGFTIIELVVVVAVVSILATLAYTSYSHFLKKARTMEAQSILGSIAKQELTYYVAHDEYTDDPDVLGIPNMGSLKFYTFSITVPEGANPQTFLATASGNIDRDALLDEWTIDQNKDLNHTIVD